jgi:hypothetical protein
VVTGKDGGIDVNKLMDMAMEDYAASDSSDSKK